MSEFAIYSQNPLCFKVTNVNRDKKIIKVFHYPLPYACTIDLMQKKGIAEQDIKTSLLKGELNFKIRVGDILIDCSDIDVLTFNAAQKSFLYSAGINIGVEATTSGGGGGSVLDYAFKQGMPLFGIKDGKNNLFQSQDHFIYGQWDNNFFRPQVFHNGRLLYDTLDYVVGQTSSLVYPYFNTIRFVTFTPSPKSNLLISYSIPVTV